MSLLVLVFNLPAEAEDMVTMLQQLVLLLLLLLKMHPWLVNQSQVEEGQGQEEAQGSEFKSAKLK
jgi:hypothetical protein